jgi:hypothetical protein
MDSSILLYVGSVIVAIWGAAHIAATKAVVEGFGPISADNRRIITMEWVAEGLTLCFIGLLVLVVALWGPGGSQVSTIVFRAAALMLIVMAIWTALTGARTSVVPIKICPAILTISALLVFLGTLL